MTNPVPDLTALLQVLAEMRETDAQWQRDLATYTGPDGDIDTEHHEEYEKAKLDHGWDLVTSHTDWVTRLTTALGTQDAT